MDDSKVFMFPDAAKNSIDPGLLALLNNSGGFGNNNWIWVLFLWMMWGANGNGWGNGFGGNNGTGYLANQMSNDAGRDLLLQAINGRADALSQLATMTGGNLDQVRTVLGQIQLGISQATAQTGMSGLETVNALQLGNANLSRQICECCCENRLAIANQTAALQSTMANNHATAMLEAAKAEAADQLAVCQQTNQLGSQADRNTNSILSAIAGQNTLITKEFCDLKERELQNKIDTQGDIITQLRGQISNDKQTEAFNAAMNALNEKINILAAKQPNTVPVQYPNIVAANATPYVGNYGFYPQNNFWN
jgi:hypothetical protein